MLVSLNPHGWAIIDLVFLDDDGALLGTWPAKIDTGAGITAIPWKCMRALGLVAGGISERVYGFDPRSDGRRYFECDIRVRVESCMPIEVRAIVVPRRKRVLLGVDFLRHHTLGYDGLAGWAGLEDARGVGSSMKALFAPK